MYVPYDLKKDFSDQVFFTISTYFRQKMTQNEYFWEILNAGKFLLFSKFAFKI